MNTSTDDSDITVRNNSIPSNSKKQYVITQADLPVSCPMPEMELWNSHPRVYISLDPITGRGKCPYCGAEYVLEKSS
ncbi:MAG: zinc-finger domain-containing protein [Gammaproteobacteria bacterium]|nr:MAG: zinc-finger domain-containing protein [Gammaproteobacteria bacterium]